MGTANSTTTQVINNSGEWTGSVIPAAKLSTATTQASSENSTKIATTAYVKSQSYLTTSGKAADSNLLDGIDSSAFLRSNAADTASGVISFTGGHGAINITNSSILSSATSNWTGNPGGAGKIQYHSNRWYIVSDSSSNRVVQFRRNSSDVSYIANNGDFIGNVTGALTGNASTATTLATARTIAGTSFNGSANINISYNNLTNKPTIPSAYSLPLSSSSTRGGVKIGFSESGKNYPVELDSSEKMFVNVPWVDTNTDTNTTYSAGTGITLSGTTFSLTDTASKLSLSGGTMTGTLNSRDIKLASGYHLQRSNHHSGHLEGSYNNVGANGSKSNPIYTIGSGYNPSDAALVSMYGIGYSHTDASFISFTGASGWGQYVAADGDARIFLCGSNGVISSTGQHYVGSSVVWNAGNDGSGSGLDADLLDGLQLHTGRNNVANRVVRTDGNGYIQAGWINTTSGNNGTTAISRIYASQDGYIRYYTPANFGAQIGSHISYNDLTNKPTIPSAYSLPLASSSTRGGVKIGFAESGKNYPVELDSSEKMFVNVPWVDTNTDTNTTYSAGRGLDLSGTQFQLETDLRDSVSHIGYDSGDYVQWSNNSYFRSVVNGSERFRVNTSGIDVTGSTTSSGFLTDTTNTQYNLLTRNHTSNTLYVQAAQSGSTQGIASFRYGSATANAGTEVLAVRRNSSYFINTKLGVGTSSPQTSLDVSGTIHQTIYNATSLPSASPAGQRAFAYSFYPLATSHGSVVSTNGSYVIPVYSDGSSWRAG